MYPSPIAQIQQVLGVRIVTPQAAHHHIIFGVGHVVVDAVDADCLPPAEDVSAAGRGGVLARANGSS